MKNGIRDYFSQYQAHDVPPVPQDKTGRGFNHIETARALCPRAYIYKFDNDETYALNSSFIHANTSHRFLERITSGEVEVTPDAFPNFLYDESEAEELLEENPEGWNAENGLLLSSLCLWVSSCFFFGVSLFIPVDSVVI
jgi:hypothetical protein